MSDQDLAEVEILRCHRFGNRNGPQAKNIVARMNSKGKYKVLAHTKNLMHQDKIRIVEQFPPEKNSRRNKLWPTYIQAKQAGKNAKFNADKLVIGNKVHYAPKDQVTDINMDVTKRALEMESQHTSVTSIDNNHFQGHIVSVKSKDEVIPALQALCTDQRVAGATNLTYAYKIGTEGYYISNFEDDGAIGAGREVMDVLNERHCFNYLVAVTHWNNGRRLGSARLHHVRKCAEDALSKL